MVTDQTSPHTHSRPLHISYTFSLESTAFTMATTTNGPSASTANSETTSVTAATTATAATANGTEETKVGEDQIQMTSGTSNLAELSLSTTKCIKKRSSCRKKLVFWFLFPPSALLSVCPPAVLF